MVFVSLWFQLSKMKSQKVEDIESQGREASLTPHQYLYHLKCLNAISIVEFDDLLVSSRLQIQQW